MIDYNILIDRFLNITEVIGNPDEGYKYDAISHFQTNWNLESLDFRTMFRTAFAKRENLFYQNSWGFIDKCAEHFPEITKMMFRNLYDENINLEIRISNFQNKADELLDQLKSQLNRDNLNAQQDERTVSVYLGFRYPEKYIFYMFSFYGRLALEFKIIGDFREKKNYLKLLSLLPDFKNAVQERKDFVERYRSFYPAPGWDDTNLMIQNILYVGYRFDLDGINDGSLLHFSKNELLNYYQILDKLIERFTLKKKDYRIVFNESEKQLNFTVGQKYVWCLKSKNKINRYRAIANEKFGQSIEIFNSEANKFLNDTDDFNLINKNFDLIASAIGYELEKTKKSGYYKFNSEFFERMAFDKEFRTLILEKIVAENDDFHYYLIGEYEEWYFKKYGKSLDSFLFAMIYGFLYQIEEQELLSKYELDHYNHSTIHCLINEIPNFKYDGLDVFELFLQQLLQKTNMKTNPLNQILYGPPGTGKTYNTINKAIGIANPEFDLSQGRNLIKEEYHRLVDQGQIVFTTFHQSMSYEDFIEGIKPHKTDDNDVYYDVDKGLFRNICEKASEKRVKSNNFSEVYSKLLKEIDNSPESKLVLETISQAKEFTIYKNSKGNIRFHANTEKAYEGVVKKEILEHYLTTGEALDWPSYTKSISKYISDKYSYSQAEENMSKNFVLIIDEINRGNVSQIFGELITLIEEGKRIGNEEELKVTLPYSKKEFGVPSNLYIIGTMNTADRSVEALDTALRRRFSFVEMMPDVEVVMEKQFSDYARAEIMQKINERIELLLDKNYTLGHSYFIKDDFKFSFKNEIIPLLQEYFYNDCGKIGLILGKGFVREKEISKLAQKNVFADFDTRNEIDIIKSYEFIPFDDVDFNNALELLLA